MTMYMNKTTNSFNLEPVSQVCKTMMKLCFFVRWRMSYQRFNFIFLKLEGKKSPEFKHVRPEGGGGGKHHFFQFSHMYQSC